jgi:hypothetical protein
MKRGVTIKGRHLSIVDYISRTSVNRDKECLEKKEKKKSNDE